MSARKRKLRSEKSAQNDRGGDGKFFKKCGCIIHSQWTQNTLFEVFNLKTSKKFSFNVIKEMKAAMYLSEYGTLVCNVCYSKFKETRYVQYKFMITY